MFAMTATVKNMFVATSQSTDFCYKCWYLCQSFNSRWPDKIVLLRGNHESRQITQIYGFYGKTQVHYSPSLLSVSMANGPVSS